MAESSRSQHFTPLKIPRVDTLEHDFVPSFVSTLCVRTSDNAEVKIHKDLWVRSPILRVYEKREKFRVIGNRTTVNYLNDIHEDGEYPTDHKELLDVMALSFTLGLHDIVRGCIDLLFEKTKQKFGKTIRYIDDAYPSKCSANTVVNSFAAFCQSPGRTQAVYAQELGRIQKIMEHNKVVMSKALDLAREKLQETTNLRLTPLPVSMNVRAVPVGLFETRTGYQLKIYYKNAWTEVVLMRTSKTFFNEVQEFYLKYNKFFMYLNCSREIHIMKLVGPASSKILAKGAEFLFSKEDHIFVGTKSDPDDETTDIKLWADEELTSIYQGKCFDNVIDYEPCRKYLCIQLSPNLVSIHQLEQAFLKHITNFTTLDIVISLYYFNQGLYIWKNDVKGPCVCDKYEFTPDENVSITTVGSCNKMQRQHKTQIQRRQHGTTLFEIGSQKTVYHSGVQPACAILDPKCLAISDLFLLPTVVDDIP